MNKQSFSKIKDFFISICSSVLLTGVTQLAVYPLLGRWLDVNTYGAVLTLIGVVNALGAAFGSSLNNTRILKQCEYDDKKLVGDFNIISVICVFFVFALSSIIVTVILGVYSFESVTLGIVAVCVFFRGYYSANFRIEINYKKYFLSNLFGVIGYIGGLIVTYFTKIWELTFLFGEFGACIYICIVCKMVREPFKRTTLFRSTSVQFICFFFATAVSSVITYLDRFFLYPVLGGESVSIYNTASVLGKVAGIIISPITGVLLTYYCKEKNLTVGDFIKRIALYIFFSAVAYLGIVLIGKPILRFLYPTIASISEPYFYIANLGAVLLLLGNTIMPTLLRYCKAFWQPIIQVAFTSSYIIFCFLGMKKGGLYGFCWSVTIVNMLRVMILIIIALFTLIETNKNKGEKQND